MRRKQTVLLAALAAAAVLVLWLALASRQPPQLPTDATHASWDDPATCLACHAPGAAVPQSANHPLGDDCLRCHGRR
jgi:hypothetical protein